MAGSYLAVAALSSGLPAAVVSGIVIGSVIALGAIGLSLIYSIAEVPNFAHGELLTMGAYLALFVNKPSRVPLLDELTTGTQNATPLGQFVLFALTALSVLAIVYHFGGDEPFGGEWWPYDVPERVAYGVHLAVAAVVGVVVVLTTPSIWGGMLFAALGMAALAPTFERVVFRRFRQRGDDLATLLIAALGLSFVLRYGTQAYFGATQRTYVLPATADLPGLSVPLASVFFFDVFTSGWEVVVRITGTPGDRQVVRAVLNYSLPALVAIVAVPLLAAYLGHRFRSGGTDEFTAGQTVGPRLTAGIAWFASTFALLLLLPGQGTVPAQPGYATRIRLSFIRALAIVIAAGMIGSLHVLLKQTKLGVAMRAASDNLDLAKVTGINTQRVMMTSWIVAGAFAAIAGVMLGILFITITPNRGFNLLLPMFAGVILGGVDSVYGAMIGSYVVGLSIAVGLFYLPVSGIHRVSIAFAVLIVILLVKPEGILGGS